MKTNKRADWEERLQFAEPPYEIKLDGKIIDDLKILKDFIHSKLAQVKHESFEEGYNARAKSQGFLMDTVKKDAKEEGYMACQNDYIAKKWRGIVYPENLLKKAKEEGIKEGREAGDQWGMRQGQQSERERLKEWAKKNINQFPAKSGNDVLADLLKELT